MKSFYSRSIFITLGILLSTVFYSCKDDKEEVQVFPTIDRGHTEVNRMIMTFNRVVGNTTIFEDSIVIYDLDGEGGNPPIVLDTLELTQSSQQNATIDYEANLRFYVDGTEVNGIINANYDDYIVCYRDYQFQEIQLLSRNNDPDGNPLGLYSEWQTKGSTTKGMGTIRLTLNYQPLAKNGLCDAGVVIFEYKLPYRLK